MNYCKILMALVLLVHGASFAEEAVRPATPKETAGLILDELRIVEGARVQAEEELELASGTVIPPATLKTFFKRRSRLYETFSGLAEPVDVLGNPYGPVIAREPLRISNATFSSLKEAVPAKFFSKFSELSADAPTGS